MEALFTRLSVLIASAGRDRGNSGGAVSRIERKIERADEVEIEADDILAALAADGDAGAAQRKEAFSRYLSASHGWREASALLGGAFAPGGAEMKSGKDE